MLLTISVPEDVVARYGRINPRNPRAPMERAIREWIEKNDAGSAGKEEK